jgi:diguanylate cyclase (GGDEF)-like protein
MFNRVMGKVAKSTPALIWSATAAGLLVQFSVFAVIAFEFYRATLDNSFVAAENTAALIEQDISRNIQLYDISLRSVAEKMDDAEVMALPPRLRGLAIFDSSSTAPGLGAMVVLDRNGSIVLDSLSAIPRKGNFADREYFQYQRDTPREDGIYISKPFQARLQDDKWSISVSRRLTGADGSFNGIVSGTLKLEFLSQRMDSMALGKRGVSALFRNDGIVLAQNIEGNPNVGADWSKASAFAHLPGRTSGTYAAESAIDKVSRLFAFSRIAGFPLVIVAGISRADVLAPLWFKIELLAAVFAVMALSVMVLVAMFNRELRRRIVAEQGQAALARRDRLSQLSNRLGFDEALSMEWRRAVRNRQPLSLLMIDVDQFKGFNDRYGHPEGDKVLTAIGGAIGGAIRRPGDIAARYGGEEFVVLLPNTGADGAMRIAETIRQGVFSIAVPHERSSHRYVTVSIGVATVVPGKAAVENTLIENADRALYAAKAGGRNRICVDNVAAISEEARFRA